MHASDRANGERHPNESEAGVVASSVRFAYRPGRENVIDGLSFEIPRGRVCAVVGPSGSGKSTLLQLLAGLLRPQAGSIQICGMPVGGRTGRRFLLGRVALVMQYPERHFFRPTVREEIAFSLRRAGIPEPEAELRIGQSLRFLPGPPAAYLDRSPFSLSGGEQRAVALAVALAMQPQVLLLDEPGAGLDPATHRSLLDHLDAWRRQSGSTVLIVSHDLGEIGRLADSILALKDGRLLFYGTPAEFFADPGRWKAAGARLPAVLAVLDGLRRAGIETPFPLFDVDAAADAIAAAFG